MVDEQRSAELRMLSAEVGGREDPTVPPAEGAVALYRFFDERGDLLYVGITSVPTKRWPHHRTHAALTWWPRAAVRRIQWFRERADAAAAELQAIRTEVPLYNTAGARSSRSHLMDGERLSPLLNVKRFAEGTGGHWGPDGLPRAADVAVALTLTAEMDRRLLEEGQRLPSISSLVSRFGVSPGVIRKAIRLLVEDGRVESRGSGTLTRYFIAEWHDDRGPWRPQVVLGDGRNALDVLVEEMRSAPVGMDGVARRIGLSSNLVRSWCRRHPEVQQLLDDAYQYASSQRWKVRREAFEAARWRGANAEHFVARRT